MAYFCLKLTNKINGVNNEQFQFIQFDILKYI